MGLNQAREVATTGSARTSARPSGRQFFEGRHLTGLVATAEEERLNISL
jgi:hypothetical protein